jgi:hypothetical protein
MKYRFGKLADLRRHHGQSWGSRQPDALEEITESKAATAIPTITKVRKSEK